MKAGTGFCQAPAATPELAAEAVRQALERAGSAIASDVVLFLTPEFARDPQPAITAAARAARCTQVTGCTAVGVFNEEHWVLDAAAATALVIEQRPEAPPDRGREWALMLATPDSLAQAGVAGEERRCGALSSAASARGPHAVWNAGRIAASGQAVRPLRTCVGLRVGSGLRPLSVLMQVTASSDRDLLSCDHLPAAATLARAASPALLARGMPHYSLAACLADEDPEPALASGRYEIVPVLDIDAREQSVSVARRLGIGTSFFWALRDPASAASEWKEALQPPETLPPACGLMFSCLSRGAPFYGGRDRDWEAVRERFPGLPFAGFYGNGEIAWKAGANRLLQYASVLALLNEPREIQ
jgi:small ligand-binding sensory domain FIST